MKERPIIFSTPMVRAILEGRKTMTRRIIKPQPKNGMLFNKIENNYALFFDDHLFEPEINESEDQIVKCPYGKLGDVLWVREAWCVDSDDIGYYYKSSMPESVNDWSISWKSPLFLPKAAARIWLEITWVSVERLDDINLQDIEAEGLPINWRDVCSSPYEWLETLWKKIIGKESWDANPWVWVITFKRIEK